MVKKLAHVFSNKYFLIAFIVFLLGTFLRFYKLEAFVTFLGDQGRDAIIIKRILSFEHFPAIGPPTSVGQIYLGPFYYYFIAPWLLLFFFNPLGPAFGIAVFMSLYILINYFVIKETLDEKIALISTALVAFSATLIDFSRFSWNPNPLPLFALLTVYFLIKAVKKHDWRFYALTGAFLSFSIQLHYLALFLFPPLAVYFALQLFEQRKKIKQVFIGGLTVFGSFLFFSIPLVIFDLRHQFLNSRNFLTLFQTTGAVASNKLGNLLNSFQSLNKYTFHADLSPLTSSLLLLLFVISFILVWRKKGNLRTYFLFFILIAVGTSVYGGPKYPHYFGAVYPFYYVILGYFLSLFFSHRFLNLIIVIFFAVYLVLNSQGYLFLSSPENNQIQIAKNIARVIYDNSEGKAFRLTSLPQEYSDYTYRYFLEVWGRRAIEKGSFEQTPLLFVVCETACTPMGDPQWDVAYFAARRIVGSWEVGSVTIYKLTH